MVSARAAQFSHFDWLVPRPTDDPADLAEHQMNGYRVSFCGVFPSLLPSGNDRITYTRLCETREMAEALFAEPFAYQLDRWEPETGWVSLAMRDRVKGTE